MQDVLADIQRKIYIDSLTGVYNRRFFDEMMFLHHQHQEQVESLTLILFDMQHFKFINDTYGHLVGDQVLHGVAQAVQAQTRSDDSVIRYGGDEFVVMLTNCSEDAVKNKIDSLKKAVQTVRYGNAAEYQAAAEFGYAYAPHFERRSERLREMFRQADQMVYENKALLKAKAGMRK